MSDEKRMIENFEVKHAVQLGGTEVIFAVDPTAKESYMVCDCTWDNPFCVDEYKNGMVGDDPVEMLFVFTDRLSERMNTIKAERTERGIPFETLSTADCVPKGMDADLEGSVLVVKPEKLSPEYRSIDHQLVLCIGGNGSRPNAHGRAVFGKNIYSGKSSRWERLDIAGVLLPERLPDWAKEKLTELEKPTERGSVVDKLRQGKTQMGTEKNDQKKRTKGGIER